jgi:antitoxin ParD1/3/4
MLINHFTLQERPMSEVESVMITMPAEMMATLRKSVADGEYASASEVVREALGVWARQRDAERRELEALREAVRVGDESGPSIPAAQVFAEMREIIADRRASS